MKMNEHAFAIMLDFSGPVDVAAVQQNLLAAIQRAAADGAISEGASDNNEEGLTKVQVAGPFEAYHWTVGGADYEVEKNPEMANG